MGKSKSDGALLIDQSATFFLAVADFVPEGEGELPVSAGDIVKLWQEASTKGEGAEGAEEVEEALLAGWVLVQQTSQPCRAGYVPKGWLKCLSLDEAFICLQANLPSSSASAPAGLSSSSPASAPSTHHGKARNNTPNHLVQNTEKRLQELQSFLGPSRTSTTEAEDNDDDDDDQLPDSAPLKASGFGRQSILSGMLIGDRHHQIQQQLLRGQDDDFHYMSQYLASFSSHTSGKPPSSFAQLVKLENYAKFSECNKDYFLDVREQMNKNQKALVSVVDSLEGKMTKASNQIDQVLKAIHELDNKVEDVKTHCKREVDQH